jgi:hypothetical protein
MLTAAVAVFTRPTNSSMRFGRLPAEGMTVGAGINLGTAGARW